MYPCPAIALAIEIFMEIDLDGSGYGASGYAVSGSCSRLRLVCVGYRAEEKNRLKVYSLRHASVDIVRLFDRIGVVVTRGEETIFLGKCILGYPSNRSGRWQ